MAQELTSQDLSATNSEEILLGKLLEASSCERAGDMRRAATLYHEIVAADANGTWGQSAQKALETIEPQGSSPNVEDLASSKVMRDAPVDSDVATPSQVEEVHEAVVAPTELGVYEQGKFQVNVPTRLGHPVGHNASSSRVASLQRMVFGATILPIAAVSIAAFWWLPQRFERRWEETSPVSQAGTISSSEINLLVERQRQVGLLVGLLAASGTVLVMGSVMRTLVRHLNFLAQQAEGRSRGQAFDEQGLRLLGSSDDEIGQLTRAIHELGDYSAQCEEKLADAEQSKRIDLESAIRETKRLQQQVIELLVQIEEVRSGNLTARAPIIDGKVGSIADAFNATIDSLRDIVAQVVEVTQSLTQGARSGEASVRQVSDSALEQSQTLKSAREDVAAMVVSIEQVSELTQSSAQVARNAIKAAHDGDLAMDRTVVSMEKFVPPCRIPRSGRSVWLRPLRKFRRSWRS
ncbi:MAG: methyl-accepting chemotaxis protein [Coleofasciculaceae cyanobacterium RL_1_1]|nr:methyl-accepting chemotaxis protein [Coleofasciculaceae cyanobacterium RL_1_1]